MLYIFIFNYILGLLYMIMYNNLKEKKRLNFCFNITCSI